MPTVTPLRTAAFALLLAGSLLAPETPAQTGPSGDPEIVAVVTGLRNDAGVVMISLYDGPNGWLHTAVQHCDASIHGHEARCVFRPVNPGASYGIAFGHDENRNGQVDRNAIGIPTEGYGFSNDVHPRLSAPGFDRARFAFAGGSQTVRMTAQY